MFTTPTPEALLDFAVMHPLGSPGLATAIERELDITEVRYGMLLGAAANSPAGLSHDPITCRRIREYTNRARHRRPLTTA